MEKRKTGKKEKSITLNHQNSLSREFSAGGVVFKREKESLSWLVTKSSSSNLFPEPFWRLPKGWLDDKNNGKDPGPLASGQIKAKNEDLEKAALREVAEESGIEANIIEKIGTISYFFRIQDKKILKFVTFFLMEWQKNLKEGYGSETSEITWLPIENAIKKLKSSGEKKILKKASDVLSQGKLF